MKKDQLPSKRAITRAEKYIPLVDDHKEPARITGNPDVAGYLLDLVGRSRKYNNIHDLEASLSLDTEERRKSFRLLILNGNYPGIQLAREIEKAFGLRGGDLTARCSLKSTSSDRFYSHIQLSKE